jgi:hypothetical protein
MKRILLILISVIFVHPLLWGQNLVPNAGFDVTSPSCPNTLGDLDTNALPWRSYEDSPDMFHGCGFQMPSNPFGYQVPHNGQGYAGLYHFNEWGSWAEKITAPITPMQVGAYYEVSMSVSTANYSHYYTNGLAIHFRKDGSGSAPGLGTLPKVDFRNYGMIFDTANWVRLTDTLYADTAYDRIYIGNFFDTSDMEFMETNFTQTCGCGYSYVDSVVVKLISDIGISYHDTMLCDPDTIFVPYTVFGLLNANNVCTLQLSNATGSFANPLNIGIKATNTSGTIAGAIPSWLTPGSGYRIRLISSSPADTSFDNGKNISIGFTTPVKPVAGNNSPVCSNDTIKLTASTTTPGVSYSWVGPDTFSSTQQNPLIHNPQSKHQGDYIVTTRLYGCVAKDTTTVVVATTPIPSNVTASYNGPVCADDTLKLFGTAGGTSLSYTWSGPGNFSTTNQNPLIPSSTSAAGGVYWFTAKQGVCDVTDSVHVTIKPRPASFNAIANSPLCAGTTLNLTGSSTSTGVVYTWTGPVGFSASGATPFINAATTVNSGNYYVTGTLNGCALYDTVTVLVKPLPAKPTAASNTPVCAGDTLYLTATSATSGITYGWTGPGSYTSALQNPSVPNTTTSMSGDYVISTDLNGCKQMDTTAVIIKPSPAPVSASTNGPVCAGDTLHVSIGTSTAGVNYNWAGPNSFTATTQNTYVANSTTAATGWYKATLNLNGCLFSDSVYAVVKMMPGSPSVNYGTPLCVGENLQLNANTVSGATYNWSGPNSFSAAVQNPVRNTISFADTGVYYATATVNGCTSTAGSVQVSANPVPFASVLVNPGDTICAGDQVSFTALPNNHAGTPQYRWYINGLPVGSSVMYTSSSLSNNDIIYCEMTEYTKCNAPYTDKSEEITMTVFPTLAPAVTISANPGGPLQPNEYVTFTATVTNGGNNPTYQWKRNGLDVIGATGNSWGANTLTDGDNISVTLTSSYRCPQPLTVTSNSIRVSILSSVAGTKSSGLILYPNPNDGRFVLKGHLATAATCRLEITNALGQVVYTGEAMVNNGNLFEDITLPELSAGIYLLKVLTGNGVEQLRLQIH